MSLGLAQAYLYPNEICLSFQRRLLKNGTTTASYFATNHIDATLALCDIIGELLSLMFVYLFNHAALPVLFDYR